jgi:hypothetical protein
MMGKQHGNCASVYAVFDRGIWRLIKESREEACRSEWPV